MTSSQATQGYFNLVAFEPNACTSAALDASKNFWWLNNVSDYGFGGGNSCTLDKYFATPTVSPNDYPHRLAGNVWSGTSVGGGTGFSTTNSSAIVPSVSTQVGTSNYIVNEIFQGNYQLLTTGGLGNWVATSGCNAPNTTDGCTAGVNMAVLAPIIQNTLNPSAGCSLFVTTVALPSGVIENFAESDMGWCSFQPA